MNKQEFRQYPDGRILALTGESPKGLGELVFVGWSGSPDKLEEVAVTKSQLPPVVVDIPEEWKDSLRLKGFEFAETVASVGSDQRFYELEYVLAVLVRRQRRFEKFVGLTALVIAVLWFLFAIFS